MLVMAIGNDVVVFLVDSVMEYDLKIEFGEISGNLLWIVGRDEPVEHLLCD